MTVSSVASDPTAIYALTTTSQITTTSIIDSGNDGAGGARDSASISGPGKLLAELQQLQSQDPTKFKQVTADIATQLTTAAGQTSGAQANFLNSLADKFQTASTTGDVSGLQPHRHHHHTTAYNQQGQPVPVSTVPSDSTGVDLKQLFTSISSEVAQAVGA